MKLLRLRPRVAGFSLVELMVSVVIGLLAVMFATRIMTDSERSKDATLGGSDSMQNGMMAMFSISADVEQAGWGLNDPVINGCNTIFEDKQGFTLATLPGGGGRTPLAAVVIEPGGTGPDRLTLYAGSASSGTGTMRLLGNYIGGSGAAVDRVPFGFAVGDVILVAPERGGSQCALAQLSGVSAPDQPPAVQFGNRNYRYNAGALGRNFEGNATRIYNLGPGDKLAFHTWAVVDGFLRLRATDLGGGGGGNGIAVADNIVSLKAQYGFDTTNDVNPERGLEVSRWSTGLFDADGKPSDETGDSGDFQRVAAVRIAVVARSKIPERPDASGACSATTAPITVFQSAQPTGVTPIPVQLDLAVAGDAIPWNCYRYRVFETIVPVRNSAWRPTA